MGKIDLWFKEINLGIYNWLVNIILENFNGKILSKSRQLDLTMTSFEICIFKVFSQDGNLQLWKSNPKTGLKTPHWNWVKFLARVFFHRWNFSTKNRSQQLLKRYYHFYLFKQHWNRIGLITLCKQTNQITTYRTSNILNLQITADSYSTVNLFPHTLWTAETSLESRIDQKTLI